MQPEAVCKVTMACAVLHNIARQAKLPDPAPEAIEDDDDDEQLFQDARCGVATRQNLIDNFFS